MSILNNPIKRTLTASSGSASDTFTTHGLCHQIIVEPTTSSTQYDLSIVDSGSLKVFEQTGEAGTINELLILPMSGAYTVSIANATVNEDFKVKIEVRNS